MPITRRLFLRSTGVTALAGGLAPFGSALADTARITGVRPTRHPRTLVVVFLRGGIDGLNWIVPHADPDYARLRPTLRINRPRQRDGALDLDGFFGLHPRGAALRPWFESGRAVALHAVGHNRNRRSHFEEQDAWETGLTPRNDHTLGADGWLNRHLQTSTGPGPVRAVSFADHLPRLLRGAAPAYALEARPHPADSADAPDIDHKVHDRLAALRRVAGLDERIKATDPTHRFARRLRATARLIRADLGIEIIHLDFGGWDTHNRQGDGAGGVFGDKIAALSDALAAFARDLGPRLDDTLLLTLSDFGRTAAQNATGGTDHGNANALLALGGPVRSARGPVLTDWPGLSPGALHKGRDLRPTTDFRNVLAEVVRLHLGNPDVRAVLPGCSAKPVGLLG